MTNEQMAAGLEDIASRALFRLYRDRLNAAALALRAQDGLERQLADCVVDRTRSNVRIEAVEEALETYCPDWDSFAEALSGLVQRLAVYREALGTAIAILELDAPQRGHDGPCGLDSPCDGLCVEASLRCRELLALRKSLSTPEPSITALKKQWQAEGMKTAARAARNMQGPIMPAPEFQNNNDLFVNWLERQAAALRSGK